MFFGFGVVVMDREEMVMRLPTSPSTVRIWSYAYGGQES
jgi:hypothetical protein